MTSMTHALDPIDMGILFQLQENARSNTNESISEALGISGSTVGTRIRRLENAGIIEGNNPVVNYRRAGFDHHYVVTSTAPFERCDRYVEAIVEDVTGVVHVREFHTARENLSIEVVGVNSRRFEEAIAELKDLDVSIDRFEVIDRDVDQPFSHFGEGLVDEE